MTQIHKWNLQNHKKKCAISNYQKLLTSFILVPFDSPPSHNPLISMMMMKKNKKEWNKNCEERNMLYERMSTTLWQIKWLRLSNLTLLVTIINFLYNLFSHFFSSHSLLFFFFFNYAHNSRVCMCVNLCVSNI